MSRFTATAESNPRPPRGSSWLALVSAATLACRPEEIRARVAVSSEVSAILTEHSYRLVVQVYPDNAWVRGHLQEWAAPAASLQRAVTADDLRTGVPVQLLAFPDATRGKHDRNVVVAWIEPGAPTLELDGHAARPVASVLQAQSRVRSAATVVRLRLRPRC